MEPTLNAAATLDRDTQLYILERVAAAEVFERFIHTKYVGTKRFSLEGGESLIPLLDLVARARRAARRRRGRCIGMAHRGRLNVLANVMGKSAARHLRRVRGHRPESRCSAAATSSTTSASRPTA